MKIMLGEGGFPKVLSTLISLKIIENTSAILRIPIMFHKIPFRLKVGID